MANFCDLAEAEDRRVQEVIEQCEDAILETLQILQDKDDIEAFIKKFCKKADSTGYSSQNLNELHQEVCAEVYDTG